MYLNGLRSGIVKLIMVLVTFVVNKTISWHVITEI